jgi:pyruvate decarboxylase
VEEGREAEMLDWVLRECVVRGGPVYVEVPTDMVNVRVDRGRLERGIDLTPTGEERGKREEAEERVLDSLLRRISSAKQPFLMIDGFVARYSFFARIEALVRILGWPTTSTPFGKSCIDETLPNFHSIYAGLAGRALYKPWVESCDLVLRFGGLDSDVNTYGFSTLPPKGAAANLWRDRVLFEDDGACVDGVGNKSLLRKLLSRLREMDAKGQIQGVDPYPSHLGDPRAELDAMPPPDPEARIQQHDFWRRVSRFFREGNAILTETGTPSVGSREFVLPRNARLINSSIWLSIGFMLAAAQGAALAVRDIREEGEKMKKKGVVEHNGESNGHDDGMLMPVLSAQTARERTILFEGDGSFQMTAQELSTIIRHKLDLVLFLINNDGYRIERFIHGMRAHYNDVARWRYLDAPRFFGAGLDQEAAMNGVVDGEVQDGVDGDNNTNPSAKPAPNPQSKKDYKMHGVAFLPPFHPLLAGESLHDPDDAQLW